QSLCFDAWTVRQLTSDDFGQDDWDRNDAVDYRSVDQEPYDDDDSGRAIEHMDDHDLIEDIKDSADKLLGTFISLAF
ncbi:unnamed protein product, partial [Rotaria magnacalcarata]